MSVIMLFVSAFLVGLSGAMMPGPLLTYAINASLKRGYLAGPLLVVGHALLELFLVIFLMAGLNVVFKKPSFTAIIGLVGGIVLLWMGSGMVKGALRKEISLEKESKKRFKTFGLIIPGVVISLSNPYWVLWWATVGMTYLANASKIGMRGTMAFYLGHITSDLAWYTIVSVLTVMGSKFINDRAYRILVGIFGSLLIYFALMFIGQGLDYIINIF
jgi:threonine/homoserine/homoserine lactone efflux protein